jgi:hypothetical protein
VKSPNGGLILYQPIAGINAGGSQERARRNDPKATKGRIPGTENVGYCSRVMKKRKSLTTAMSGLPRKNSAEKLMMPKAAINRIKKNRTPPNFDITSITSFACGSQGCDCGRCANTF